MLSVWWESEMMKYFNQMTPFHFKSKINSKSHKQFNLPRIFYFIIIMCV